MQRSSVQRSSVRGYRRRPRVGALVGAVAAASVLMAGCTGTTYDPADARPTTPPSVSTTTTLPTGTPRELLSRLSAETQGLEHVIQSKGDVRAAIASINALWAAVRDEVADDPAMINGFEGAIRQAQRAARGKQLGYAAKAGRSIDALVTAYLNSHPA